MPEQATQTLDTLLTNQTPKQRKQPQRFFPMFVTLCAHLHDPHQDEERLGGLAPEYIEVLDEEEPVLFALQQPSLQRLIEDSASFVAPEVKQGEEPSPTSEVFSLGVLLYTLMSGTAPLGAYPPALANNDFQDLLLHPIDQLIAKACAREPEERYQDVDAFLYAFQWAKHEYLLRKKIEEEIKDKIKDELKDKVKDQLKDMLKEQLEARAKQFVQDSLQHASQYVAGTATSQASGVLAGASQAASISAAAGTVSAGGAGIFAAGSAAFWVATSLAVVAVAGATGYFALRQPTKTNTPAKQTLAANKQTAQPKATPKQGNTQARKAPPSNRQTSQGKTKTTGQPQKKTGQPQKTSLCKQKNGVFIKVLPALRKNADVDVESGKAHRVKGGFCVPASPGEILVEQKGFAQCVFQLPKQKNPIIYLKKEGLTLLSADYCLKKQP
ncbi:MAG TPA: hypothetical protein DCE42_23445 [Myxococcales bacterium]|nr:hypothetical protein [Deltaproteobacteria bacterium]HAA57742.1 hypothetical protein [Myxococcales bacterium]|tara:strand:+ start:2494 stop:3816 length:1323 start_codon:yes stop_codon:yes gene_type:complete